MLFPFAICVFLLFTFEESNCGVVRTPRGLIIGRHVITADKKVVNYYTGIPFAKPPVGDLRFRDPQEPEEQDIIWAKNEPPICIQRDYLSSDNPPIIGSEDCLYLNVFTPDKHPSPTNLRPVMVYLYWGANLAGRSTTGYLGPEYFLEQDVVLVTFNYRLGPFGFLSTTDDEAPGNFGYKDQVAALKWVQKNIEYFGGDKNQVTIFGTSAGSCGVHFHLLSPSSKGLFHRAISQSGNGLSGFASPLNSLQKEAAFKQGSMVGCNSTDSKEMIDCLRSVSAEDILQTQDLFRTFYGNPMIVFSTVTETKSERNPNPFLTKLPKEYILNGEIHNVTWMTGVVKNEGDLRIESVLRPKKVRDALNQNFEEITTDLLLQLGVSTSNKTSLYKNISEFYLGGKDYIDINDNDSIQGLLNFYSDRAIMYPLYQALKWHSRQHQPIYLYNFEYKGAETYGNLFAGTNETIDFDWGTCHCDDLLYLFRSPDLFPNEPTAKDRYMTNVWVTTYANFAKYGVPTPPESEGTSNKLFTWNPVHIETEEKAYMDIQFLNITGSYVDGPKFEMGQGYYPERMKFWIHSDILENIEN